MNNHSPSHQSSKKAAKRASFALVIFLLFAFLLWYFSGDERYLWLKAVHIIAVISWMAGMVYLPRLFVYHADAEHEGELDKTLQIMERRLMKIIMTPAMLITWAIGLYLAFQSSLWAEGWFITKFIAVLLMSAMHMFLARCIKEFASGTNTRSAQTWRALNEIPTVLMIVTVIMVIVKPY